MITPEIRSLTIHEPGSFMSWIFAKNARLVTWWSTGVASGRGRGWLVSVVVGTDETTNATGSVLEYEALLIA